MSKTSLGITLIDEGTKVDNDLLNTNYQIINDAIEKLKEQIMNTKIVGIVEKKMAYRTSDTVITLPSVDYDYMIITVYPKDSSHNIQSFTVLKGATSFNMGGLGDNSLHSGTISGTTITIPELWNASTSQGYYHIELFKY